MHRATLWIFSALTIATVGAVIVYQLHIGSKYLPPLSLSGAGSSGPPPTGGGSGGGGPSASRIADICKQISQNPSSRPGGGGAPR